MSGDNRALAPRVGRGGASEATPVGVGRGRWAKASGDSHKVTLWSRRVTHPQSLSRFRMVGESGVVHIARGGFGEGEAQKDGQQY